MRLLLILIAVLIAAPVQAQRVFRATLPEVAEKVEKHDKRLDSVESRVETLEKTVAEKATPVPDPLPDAEPTEQPAKPAATQPTVSAEPSPSFAESYIVKESVENCPPCIAWDREARPQIEALGWDVVDETMTDPSGQAPRFRVVIEGTEYKHQGSLRWIDLWDILSKHNGEPNPYAVAPEKQPTPRPVSARYSTSELRQQINALAPSGWQRLADVSPRSMAKQHLVGPEHGFSWDQVSGLTQEEALILHDYAPGHGNRIFPVRRGRDARFVTTEPQRKAPQAPSPQPAEPGCANGGCAKQSTMNYRFNFSGWYPGKLLGR